MPNCSGSGKTARCAVCDGKFGLVRYYSWRTALCSKKCVDRLRARRVAALAPNQRRPSNREPREGSMRIQLISQRRNEYLKTTETSLRLNTSIEQNRCYSSG
jgi:hypothetical protein